MSMLLDKYKYGFEIEPNLNIHNISNISEYHHNNDEEEDDENDDYEDNENYNKKSNNILIDKKINQYNKFLTTGIEVKDYWNRCKRFVLIKNIEGISEYEDPDNSSVLLARIICYNDELSLDTYESFESVLKKYKDAVALIEK